MTEPDLRKTHHIHEIYGTGTLWMPNGFCEDLDHATREANDEFAEKLLEAMSTPINPNTQPSAWTCGYQETRERATDTPPAD